MATTDRVIVIAASEDEKWIGAIGIVTTSVSADSVPSSLNPVIGMRIGG